MILNFELILKLKPHLNHKKRVYKYSKTNIIKKTNTLAQIRQFFDYLNRFKMFPPPDQTIMYNIVAPHFLNSFKQQTLHIIIPCLVQLKAYLNADRNETTVNPLITIVAFAVLFYLLQSVWVGLFGKRALSSDISAKQSPQLNAELNDLKKQLKSLKSSFSQLIKQLPHAISQIQIAFSKQTHELLAQVIPLYTESLQNNKNLVNYVLESQFQVLKELKKFKKAQRACFSTGRPSISTIKSKTQDKKFQNSASRSPLKPTIFNPITSLEKPQIKSSQRPFGQQIIQKTQKGNEKSFIKVVQNLQEKAQKNPTQQERNQGPINNMIPKKTIQKVQKLSIQQNTTINKSQNIKQSQLNIQNSVKYEQKVERVQKIKMFQNSYQKKEQTIVRGEIEENYIGIASQLDAPKGINNKQFDSLENRQIQEQEVQLEEPQVFTAPKLPAIKKLNPPKPGGKRPPPPPPKR